LLQPVKKIALKLLVNRMKKSLPTEHAFAKIIRENFLVDFVGTLVVIKKKCLSLGIVLSVQGITEEQILELLVFKTIVMKIKFTMLMATANTVRD
jgi:hypothetical protein